MDGGFHGTTHRTVATVCNGDQEVPVALLFLNSKPAIQNTELFSVSGSEYQQGVRTYLNKNTGVGLASDRLNMIIPS